MTRLRQEDLIGIHRSLDRYDEELVAKTGRDLQGIACGAAHIEPDRFQRNRDSVTIGIIPFSCGEGIIEGFSQAVLDIIKHIGFRGFITIHPDISGLAEAVDRGADIVMMADDIRFIALNIRKRRVIDNAHATGNAYAYGLSLMAGGVEKKRVLLIGCGRVGRAAAVSLLASGAKVSLFDVVEDRSNQLACELNQLGGYVDIAKNLSDALLRTPLILQAASMDQGLDSGTLHPKACIARRSRPSARFE
jgi:pyrrolysine biosynthesis protein PylD